MSISRRMNTAARCAFAPGRGSSQGALARRALQPWAASDRARDAGAGGGGKAAARGQAPRTEGVIDVEAWSWRSHAGPRSSLGAYVRRFDLEHTLRFNQTLGWTTLASGILSRPTGGAG
jgi:hypothetical protein